MIGVLYSLLAATLLAAPAIAIPTISIKGSKFFADGKQFFIKGVAYQGTPADPLTNATQCHLDATLMKSIGVNSIRVYHVSPLVDHDGCMKTFEDAGIYVWMDVETYDTSINQNKPLWDMEKLTRYMTVVDNFHKYDNVAGFFIGNEVINTKNGSLVAPYVKAAAADLKKYISSSGIRKIPVGYSAADITELRPMLQDYLVCGVRREEAVDFYGLNSYEWCGNATYETSGYTWLQTMSHSYPAPLFFSETGCNVGAERTFKDQQSVFGIMKDTFSGAIVYEWAQETNNYGLVKYPNYQTFAGAPIPIQPDFGNLARQWRSIGEIEGVRESDYSPKAVIPSCPEPTLGWMVEGEVSLPRVKTMSVDLLVSSSTFAHMEMARSIQARVPTAHNGLALMPAPVPGMIPTITFSQVTYPPATTSINIQSPPAAFITPEIAPQFRGPVYPPRKTKTSDQEKNIANGTSTGIPSETSKSAASQLHRASSLLTPWIAGDQPDSVYQLLSPLTILIFAAIGCMFVAL